MSYRLGAGMRRFELKYIIGRENERISQAWEEVAPQLTSTMAEPAEKLSSSSVADGLVTGGMLASSPAATNTANSGPADKLKWALCTAPHPSILSVPGSFGQTLHRRTTFPDIDCHLQPFNQSSGLQAVDFHREKLP